MSVTSNSPVALDSDDEFFDIETDDLDSEERPMLYERSVPRSWVIAKRLTDVVIAGIALPLAAPIMLVAVAAIVINSPGSPIFAQERVGLNGRRFTMFKLRTMKRNAHDLQD